MASAYCDQYLDSLTNISRRLHVHGIFLLNIQSRLKSTIVNILCVSTKYISTSERGLFVKLAVPAIRKISKEKFCNYSLR